MNITPGHLEVLIQEARAQEREACAKVLESKEAAVRMDYEPEFNGFQSALDWGAAAIRARKP